MEIELQQKHDTQAVENLLDMAFGKDRFSKATYGLREGVDALSELSFVMRDQNKLVASLRFWPILIGKNPALLLGPIAVITEYQGQGHGLKLMKEGLDVAKSLGHLRVVLVGDEVFYKRAGFERSLATRLIFPKQKDQNRILACELKSGAFKNIAGKIQSVK